MRADDVTPNHEPCADRLPARGQTKSFLGPGNSFSTTTDFTEIPLLFSTS